MTGDWHPIDEAQHIRLGTVVELRMENGRVYRATWREKGLVTAWWLDPGQRRKREIGLYDPVEFRVLAEGHSFDDGTREGMRREKERLEARRHG
jgi:hypothetical protein